MKFSIMLTDTSLLLAWANIELVNLSYRAFKKNLEFFLKIFVSIRKGSSRQRSRLPAEQEA